MIAPRALVAAGLAAVAMLLGTGVNGHDVLLVGGRLRSRSADSRNPSGRTVVLT
jgi:hypothetical protein